MSTHNCPPRTAKTNLQQVHLIVSPECFLDLIEYKEFRISRGTSLDTFAPTIHESARTSLFTEAMQILFNWYEKGNAVEILARKDVMDSDAGFWDIICRTSD